MKIPSIINNIKFIKFVARMTLFSKEHSFSHSMIGCNFNENGISSIKFYFVFYGENFINCPIPKLEKLFKSHISSKDNYYLSTKLSPGGGLTFTIKFDNHFNSTEGFYFRVAKSNATLVTNIINVHPEFNFSSNDFDHGYGQYVLLKEKDITTKEYLYMNNVEKLIDIENKYDILFSQSKLIEISAANVSDKNEQKFIALGLKNLFKDSFKKKLPRTIVKYAVNNNLHLICPAISTTGKINSIYMIGQIDSGIFKNQAIELN